MPASAYTPIACGFHDRLEHWAVRREPVALVWRDDADAERTATVRIADLFARDGADWLRLASEDGRADLVVRADQVVSANGYRLVDAC